MNNSNLETQLEQYYSIINIDKSKWANTLFDLGRSAYNHNQHRDAATIFSLSFKYGNENALDFFRKCL